MSDRRKMLKSDIVQVEGWYFLGNALNSVKEVCSVVF